MKPFEKSLIESIKKGNEKSFELVFKTFYPKLCVYAFNYTKQIEVAEDLVKDFFIDFWEKREKITINSSLSGYLFRSVHNACINFIKREKNNKEISYIDDLSRIELIVSKYYPEDFFLNNLMAIELEEQISTHIDKLPPHCKEIFVLSRIEGLSHKKIAERLHISENTVKSQIFRALIKLKDVLIALFLFYL